MEYKVTKSITGILYYYEKIEADKWIRVSASSVPDFVNACAKSLKKKETKICTPEPVKSTSRASIGTKTKDKSPTKNKRTSANVEVLLPLDVIRTILTFCNIEDLFKVCTANKEWKARCGTSEFWTLYLKNKNQDDFNDILLAISGFTDESMADLFFFIVEWNLLWP
jgi:hypothetical protein